MAEMIGGIFPCVAFALFFLWLFKKFGITSDRRYFYATFATLCSATLIAGFGMADGGPPDFGRAFTVYLMPAAIAGVIIFAINNKPEPVDMNAKKENDE